MSGAYSVKNISVNFILENDSSKFCRSRENRLYADPDKCDGFISCWLGDGTLQNWPNDLKFNEEKQACDYPACKTTVTTEQGIFLNFQKKKEKKAFRSYVTA